MKIISPSIKLFTSTFRRKMKTCIIFLVFAISLVSSETIQEKWEQFRMTHKKVYGSSLEERTRFSIFQENVRKIEEHNKKFEQGLSTYQMGINHFADLTSEEFLDMFGSKRNFAQERSFNVDYSSPSKDFQEADSVDWRKKGAVTPVVDQGMIGGSAAFSVLGVVESQHFLTNKKLVPLSTQEIADCNNYTQIVESVYKYVQDRGVLSASDYAKQPNGQKCKHKDSLITAQIDKVFNIKPKAEDDLTRVVTEVGPANVLIEVKNLQFYKEGIFEDKDCNGDPNHSVDIIGYGVEKEVKYWILKNSWGANWGEQGYFRMVRGVNECGVANAASYATVRKN